MKFNYQARTKEGEIRTGTVEAATQEAAATLLEAYGLVVTFLEEVKAKPIWLKEIKFLGGVAKKEIVIFSRQLSILFGAGVSLIESLRVLANQIENPVFQEKILRIIADVEGGEALSQALSHHPQLFSSFYVNMVKSGEASGTLSQSLTYLAEYLEREDYLASKIISALFYPALVLLLFGVTLLVMIFWVLPQLTVILKEVGTEPPWITRFFLGTAQFLKEKIWLIVLGILGLILFIARYKKTAEGKRNFDEISIRLPIVGRFSKMLCLTRFAENLSTLIAGGLPIAQALEITADVVGNEVYKKIIFETQSEVRKGVPISQALSRFPREIPPLFVQITLVGEQSGKLDLVLRHIVEFYRRELEINISRVLDLIGPVLILILGVAVGSFVAAILIPFYEIMARF